MYSLILVLHVICAAIWFAAFPAVFFLHKFQRKSEGTIGELHYMRAALVIGAVFGNIGGIGILITGPAMVGMNPVFGWFAFDVVPWLAWKQVVYTLLLLLTFGGFIPLGKKAKQLLGERFSSPEALSKGATPELRQAMNRVYNLAMFFNLLILLNIVLGILGVKGFMTP